MPLLIPRILSVWGSLMLLSLPTSTAAQEEKNTTDSRFCRYIGSELSSNGPVNSTGFQSFKWSQQEQDWYLTSTINDTRSPFLVTQMHDIQGYISAPANAEASACVYMFRGINVTGSGDNGCEGVLSQECVNWLTKTVSYAPDNVGGVSRCARTPPIEDVRKACGDGVVMSYSTGQFCFNSVVLPFDLFSAGYPIDFSNHTCTILSPPANSMPTDYLTYPAMGIGTSPGNSDQSYENFTHYDLYVRQTRPWLVAGSFKSGAGMVAETRVVCVAPDRVVGESRQPEGPWPPTQEGAGTRMAPLSGSMMSLFAGIFGILLIL
jgi:hypothetical protein